MRVEVGDKIKIVIEGMPMSGHPDDALMSYLVDDIFEDGTKILSVSPIVRTSAS